MALPENFDVHAAAYVHVYLAKLMTILARDFELLYYSGVPDMSSDIQAFVAKADADFQKWLSSLPPALCVSRSPASTAIHLPAVLYLHLIFNKCIVLLHRSLITAADTFRMPTSPFSGATAASLQKCVQAAQEICRLLVLFRRRYGLRRPHHQMVHVTMTASLIPIFQLCISDTSTPENKEAQQYFLACIQAFGEMVQTYKSASRALDVVTSLRQNWQHNFQHNCFAGDRFKQVRLQ
ncbi:hypothetical protein RBB50_012898 [Rhinocladiella similis]